MKPIVNILKTKFKYFIGVLSNEKKKINFYSRKLTGDSYYREQTSGYDENLEPEGITTVTLDEIIKKENLKLPNMIKIDTQGRKSIF